MACTDIQKRINSTTTTTNQLFVLMYLDFQYFLSFFLYYSFCLPDVGVENFIVGSSTLCPSFVKRQSEHDRPRASFPIVVLETTAMHLAKGDGHPPHIRLLSSSMSMYVKNEAAVSCRVLRSHAHSADSLTHSLSVFIFHPFFK
jgi:hypothetical protein